MLPSTAHLTVCCAADPSLDAWRGAATWAASNIATCSITAADYREQGDALCEHFAANTRAQPLEAGSW